MKLLSRSRLRFATIGAICAVSLLTAETVNMRKSDRLKNVTRLTNCSAFGREVIDTEEEKIKQVPAVSDEDVAPKTEDYKKEGV